ncbi:MAG: acetylxylan esterase [Planctomycetaceae bacterium]|nr:acetylxylan esterase [Planctomycetales bacterium]MCB9926855.1 acetylxylan esterase [Planctomycetaceae bacterium]
MTNAIVRALMSLTLALFCFCSHTRAESLRVYELGQLPNDSRLGEPKDLNGYFPFEVPSGRAAWETRAEELRRRVMIATDVWPMPERTPLNPVIYGKTQRDGFTVEKVYFESMPNHFVTGLLFRPDDGKGNIKRPAVLCPHGHGGRLQDYGEANMAKLIESGAEKFEKSGRMPKLARCAQLARMGCVTFIFDMLGYADSNQISRELAHGFAKQRPDFEGKTSWGLFSAQAELRLQSVMGIQTWNSIRCLDFLEQLPDVDRNRMAVTGGSGGGTQTILLCAIDPRPIAAFPNGMVSTSMQGGCTCENCTLLRVDSGNVELAALFAPKPQAMTAANDWTKEMMTKGYPELQQIYDMFGVKDNVYCREMLHFPHNYNYVSRATMYDWFNKHMRLGLDSPVIEQDWEPLTAEEYTVWDKDHPAPKGGDEYERSLTKYMAERSDTQLASLAPKNAQSLQKFREVVGGAFRSIVGREVPAFDDLQRTKVHKEQRAGYIYFADYLRLQTKGEEIPFISLYPTGTEWNGDVVIWVDGIGKRGLFADSGELRSEVRRLVDAGASIVAPDLFQQGEFLSGDQPLVEQAVVKNPREAAAYTFCYNDTVFVRRVHDILTVVSFIRGDEHAPKHLHLIGTNGAGPVAAAARAIAGGQIDKAAIDTQGFRFADLTSYRDPDFLPGAVKYGDVPALLALSAPHPLWIGGEKGDLPETIKQAFAATGNADRVTSSSLQNAADAAADWLLMGK